MRCRRATILLAGWLVMYPPYRHLPDGTWVVDFDAPTERWNQMGAHDTAAACEQEARGVVHPAKAELDKKYGHTSTIRELHQALQVAFSQAKCVPADFIYPPKQPSAVPSQ